MDNWNEIVAKFAPKGCEPTIVDNNKDYQKAKEEVAKELHKKVEELTPEEEDKALYKIGLSPLDFMD